MNTELVSPLGLTVLATCIGLAGTWLTRHYLLRRELLDHPNARSSHTVPTPRGGGVAIVTAFVLVATIEATLTGTGQLQLWQAIVPASLLVAAVGFRDDHRPVSAHARLITHFAAATWVVFLLGEPPAIVWPGGTLALGATGYALAVLALVWFLNLYNFMDGIDGIAAGEAVFVASAAAWLGGAASATFVPLLALATASAGFLAFNWPPAKIFMGDVGSGFLGIALGALLLAQAASGDLPVGAAAILPGVFVADATATLIVRLLRGDRVHEAHRNHAYQHCARRFGGHRPVTLAVLAIDLLWLLPMATLASREPEWSLPIAAAALLPLLMLALALGAGRPEAARGERGRP